MLYSIGGHILSITGQSDVLTAAQIPGMEIFACPESFDADVFVELDADIPAPSHCHGLHRFDMGNGTAECLFGIDTEGVYHHTFGDNYRLRFDCRRPNLVQCSHIGDPIVLRYVLWTAYSLAGLWLNTLPIHSSTVVNSGRAVLCLGESGTGKSTHTKLWLRHIAGSYLLNDDSPIVRVEHDGVWVYGSPWSGKTPCFRQERLPIAALLRLEQRPQNSIRKLAIVEAFTALQPSCPPALAHDEQCMDRLVAFVSEVIKRVPVYRLGCLPDADAARLSHRTIFEQP